MAQGRTKVTCGGDADVPGHGSCFLLRVSFCGAVRPRPLLCGSFLMFAGLLPTPPPAFPPHFTCTLFLVDFTCIILLIYSLSCNNRLPPSQVGTAHEIIGYHVCACVACPQEKGQHTAHVQCSRGQVAWGAPHGVASWPPNDKCHLTNTDPCGCQSLC